MKTDLLLDSTLALVEDPLTHDWVAGRSDEQHQNLCLITEKGSWKENPVASVGAMTYLEAEDPAGLLREIRQQFAADGMELHRLDITNGQLNIDAEYT